MGFFSDFIGSFTGSNERSAAKKAAEGFTAGIKFTKDEIERTRQEVAPLMEAAFANINSAADAGIDARKQALAGQLQLLGAGTEQLSPEGASNALQRGQNSASDILLGRTTNREPLAFTPVGTNPITTERPEFARTLVAPQQQAQQVPEFSRALLGGR